MQLYGFDSGGRPKGYFIETFGIYASIFSPLVFIYFIYALYRTAIKGKLDLMWYIATTTFMFSLLLSFRQRIYIEEFAPFIVIAIPLIVKTFMNSFRVRLPQFRKKHLTVAIVSIVLLILNSSILFINKPFYLISTNPQKHFAYEYHFADEIAYNLKENNIYQINSYDNKLLLRLKYYGISSGGKRYITLEKPLHFIQYFPITYKDKNIITAYIYSI